MTASVKLDIIEGANTRLSKDGWEWTRVALVSGLTGTGPEKQAAAVNAVIDIVGPIGAAHPTVAAVITEFVSSVDSSDDVRVSIIYRPPSVIPDPDQPAAVIEVGSSLSQVESNRDVNNNLISVSYKYPNDYKLDERKQGQTITQGKMLTRPAPESSFVFRRVETGSPGGKSRAYVGKVNAAGWAADPSAAEKTWLCTAITGVSNDGGETYDVTYQFQYREDTWEEDAVFINPDDGMPPADLVAGTGTKKVSMTGTANFNNLNLVV